MSSQPSVAQMLNNLAQHGLLMFQTARSSRLSEFIAVALFLAFSLGSFDAHLLVILFQGCQVFASFRELTLFHTLTDIVVDKSALGVHEVKFVIDAREDLSNGR